MDNEKSINFEKYFEDMHKTKNQITNSKFQEEMALSQNRVLNKILNEDKKPFSILGFFFNKYSMVMTLCIAVLAVVLVNGRINMKPQDKEIDSSVVEIDKDLNELDKYLEEFDSYLDFSDIRNTF